MKRDWELIRVILIMLEQRADNSWLSAGEVEGYCIEEVSYHYKLLHEAGLIEADYKGGIWWAKGLTWQGHELLESLRNRDFWNRLKKEIRDKGLILSFEAIKSITTQLIKRYINED